MKFKCFQIPVRFCWLHTVSHPLQQCSHWPHEEWSQGTVTRSPICRVELTLFTDSPNLTTVPTPSWPGVIGRGHLTWNQTRTHSTYSFVLSIHIYTNMRTDLPVPHLHVDVGVAYSRNFQANKDFTYRWAGNGHFLNNKRWAVRNDLGSLHRVYFQKSLYL